MGAERPQKIYLAKAPQEQNPKSEYRKKPRGPKQTERVKSEARIPNPKRGRFEFVSFDHLDLFRISNLGICPFVV